jgi:hypothetical protein
MGCVNKSQLYQSKCLLSAFLAMVVRENDAGNPCHEGLEATAPIGSYTCNPNISICIGKLQLQLLLLLVNQREIYCMGLYKFAGFR